MTCSVLGRRTPVGPPCAGRSALFDSTAPTDHLEAAAICRACPMVDACREQLAETRRLWGQSENYGPRGTWAGEFIGKTDALSLSLRDPRRLAAEDAMFTPETARQAHAAYQAGDRDDHTRRGERYYQRHRKATNRRDPEQREKENKQMRDYRRSKAERIDVLRDLIACGRDMDAACEALGLTRKGVDRWCRRNGQTELLKQLAVRREVAAA